MQRSILVVGTTVMLALSAPAWADECSGGSSTGTTTSDVGWFSGLWNLFGWMQQYNEIHGQGWAHHGDEEVTAHMHGHGTVSMNVSDLEGDEEQEVNDVLDGNDSNEVRTRLHGRQLPRVPRCVLQAARDAGVEFVRGEPPTESGQVQVLSLLFVTNGSPDDNRIVVGDHFLSDDHNDGETNYQMDIARGSCNSADETTILRNGRFVQVDPNARNPDGSVINRVQRQNTVANRLQLRAQRRAALFHELMHVIQNSQQGQLQGGWGEWTGRYGAMDRVSGYQDRLSQISEADQTRAAELGVDIAQLREQYRQQWDDAMRTLRDSSASNEQKANAFKQAFDTRDALCAKQSERAAIFDNFPSRWANDVHAAESEEEYWAIFNELAWRYYHENPRTYQQKLRQDGFTQREIDFQAQWWQDTFGAPMGQCGRTAQR